MKKFVNYRQLVGERTGGVLQKEGVCGYILAKFARKRTEVPMRRYVWWFLLLLAVSASAQEGGCPA